MDYIIGVDGGATKTEATAYNMRDEKIGTGLAGPGNLAIDFDVASMNIKKAISQCLDNVKVQGIYGECQSIYLGIAGIEVGDNTRMIETFIGSVYKCRIVGLHDSEMAHAAILKGKDGIITISGTGSVSYGKYKGKTCRTGGWGHVLGDEGSGYWIALEALKNMTLEQDLGQNAGMLSQTILDHLELCNPDEMKKFVHDAGKLELAAIAPIVTEVAEDGDPYAVEILNQAGCELAMMTVRLYNRLGINEPVTIGISGSILCKVNRVRKKFEQCLERDLDAVQILMEEISPTKGACYLYRRTQQK